MPGMTGEKKMDLEKGVSFGEGTVLRKEEKGKKQTTADVVGMGQQTSTYPNSLAYKVGMETRLSE